MMVFFTNADPQNHFTMIHRPDAPISYPEINHSQCNIVPSVKNRPEMDESSYCNDLHKLFSVNAYSSFACASNSLLFPVR